MTSIELYALWIKCGRPTMHEFVRMNGNRITIRQWRKVLHEVSCSGSMMQEVMMILENERKDRLKAICKRIVELSELPGEFKDIEVKLVEQYEAIRSGVSHKF